MVDLESSSMKQITWQEAQKLKAPTPELLDAAPEAVNHPPHYTADPSGIECITITRHRNFNVGNAIKYLWRAGLKDESTQIQDLEKAAWYIQDEIKRLREAK